MTNKSKQPDKKKAKRGIKIEATIGQLASAFFLVLLLFVLPVGGYEYLNARLGHGNNKEVYTTSTLENSQEQSQEQGGRVAGISTSKTSEKVENAGDVVEFITKSTGIMIAIGVVFLSVSMLLAGSLVYDFLKK